MSFLNLLWVMIFAWAVSCGYYFWRIVRISRTNGHSPFLTSTKSNSSSTSRLIIRKLYKNMLAASILFLAAVLVAYLIAMNS